jgi:mono/diheme cytochrome c family protein
MKLKSTVYVIFGSLALGLAGCTAGGDNPGIEYAPDMYVSKGYEAFTQTKKWSHNPGGMSMRLPVKGSIARGQLDYLYPYPDNGEGYEMSASLKAAIPATKEVVETGKILYNTYCWNCHGKKGGNDGPVMQEGRYVKPPWPNYQSDYIKDLPVGKIFHTITYGKGLMGSHAMVLSPKERWEVIHYVKYLAYGEENFNFDTADDNVSAEEITETSSVEMISED